MPFYRSAGIVPQKQMTRLQHPSGRFIHEELVSTLGFGGDYSFLYRLNAPTRVSKIEPIAGHDIVGWDTGPIDRNLLEYAKLDSKGDFFEARQPLAYNDTLTYSVAFVTEGMEGSFYRNSAKDELVLVADGTGVMRTQYGNLAYSPLDLIYIPRATTIQWMPESPGKQLLVVLESSDRIEPPPRYRSPNGQLLCRGLYKERDLRAPVLEDPIDETGEYSIAVSGSGGLARFTVERHPFDVVGWDGAIYPFALNLADVEPIEGRYHVTPDQSELFSAAGNAICGNVPHRRETDPSSMPAPPHHDNVDYDEIVFVVPLPGADNSRNPRAGMLWVHGRTFPHGGAPGFEEYQLPDVIEDYAYMIDTVRPMKLTTIAKDIDVSGYTTTFWRD